MYCVNRINQEGHFIKIDNSMRFYSAFKELSNQKKLVKVLDKQMVDFTKYYFVNVILQTPRNQQVISEVNLTSQENIDYAQLIQEM